MIERRLAVAAWAGVLAVHPVRAAAQPTAATNEIAVADDSRTYTVGRIVDGHVMAAAPCVATDALPDPLALKGVVAPTPLGDARAVALGSDEWNRLLPQVLALAERRERGQRLVQSTTSRSPRFLDWMFASDAGGRSTYYFEVSRRVPSVAAPLDVDVDTDPPGTIRVVVSGFARREGSSLTALGTKGELRWEQDDLPRAPSRPDLRPLGVLMLPGDPVWVMEGRTRGSVGVNLFAVGARGIDLRATTRIGGC